MRTPYAYQTEGSAFLARTPYAALLDEPGLGKSKQAIDAAGAINAQRVLVVCPAIALVSWAEEAQHQSRPVLIWPKCTTIPKTGPVFLCVTYDWFSRATPAQLIMFWRDGAFDVSILDEAHYLKSTAAKRTRAIYGRVGRMGVPTPHVWLLSGTLAPNHAGELYPHAATLWPELTMTGPNNRTMSLVEWEDRYCVVDNTPFGRVIRRSQNIDQLRAKMAPYVLRRRKADVLTDLPPLSFVDVALNPACLTAAEAEIMQRFDIASAPSGDDDFMAWLQANDMHFSTLRRAIGLAKTAGCAERIEEDLHSGTRKAIVFAHHTDVIDAHAARLADFRPVIVDGRSSHNARARAVDLFMRDPNCRVFIGQDEAASTAVTLTASSDVYFSEVSGSPRVVYQAACRAHRIGQRDGVIARFLYVPGTLDERIMRTYRRRTAEMAQLFD